MRYGDSFFKKHWKKLIALVAFAFVAILVYDLGSYYFKTFDTAEYIEYEVYGYDGKGYVKASFNRSSAFLNRGLYFEKNEPILLKSLSEAGIDKAQKCLNYISVNVVDNENLSNGDEVVLDVYVPKGKCGKFVSNQKTIKVEGLTLEKHLTIDEIMDYYDVYVSGESNHAFLTKSSDFLVTALFDRTGYESSTLKNGDSITLQVVNGKDNAFLIRDGIILEGEESKEYIVDGLDVFEEISGGSEYINQFNEEFTAYLEAHFKDFDTVDIDESMYRKYEKRRSQDHGNYCMLKFVTVKESTKDELEQYQTFTKCNALDEESGNLKFDEELFKSQEHKYSSVGGIKRAIKGEGYKIVE